MRNDAEVDMKGNPEVVGYLNEVLAGELLASNQYFMHAKLCESWGYKGLANHTREESMEEMRHAEALIDRVIFLEGEPLLRGSESVKIGRTVRDQFANDLSVELEAVRRLNRGIELCGRLGDNGTRLLLQQMLRDEEEHVSWLEMQVRVIEEVGLQNYLARQLEANAP